MFDYTVRERRVRKRKLLSMILRDPGNPKDKYIARFSNETGLSWKTIQYYLKELIVDGLLEEVNGNLYPALWLYEVPIHEAC